MASFGNLYANIKNKVEIIGDAQFSDSVRELYSRNRKTSCIETINKKIMLRADAFPIREKQNVGNLFGINNNANSGLNIASGDGSGSSSDCNKKQLAQYYNVKSVNRYGSTTPLTAFSGGNSNRFGNNAKLKNSLMNGNYGTGNADLAYGTHIDVSWLPFAAGHYHISPDINDYVVAVVPAVSSDIPNRNMQGFMTTTLFEFDTEQGCQRYKTYVGRPVCSEHNNKDFSLSYGVVIDAFLVPVPKYKIVKLLCLALIDKTKYKIKNYSNLSFSIGSLCSCFICTICTKDGHIGLLGPGVRRTCTCYHTNYTDLRSYGGIYNGRLHWLLAKDPQFFELSVVHNPADISAVGEMI